LNTPNPSPSIRHCLIPQNSYFIRSTYWFGCVRLCVCICVCVCHLYFKCLVFCIIIIIIIIYCGSVCFYIPYICDIAVGNFDVNSASKSVRDKLNYHQYYLHFHCLKLTLVYHPQNKMHQYRICRTQK
jgi:hypothetical protein